MRKKLWLCLISLTLVVCVTGFLVNESNIVYATQISGGDGTNSGDSSNNNNGGTENPGGDTTPGDGTNSGGNNGEQTDPDKPGEPGEPSEPGEPDPPEQPDPPEPPAVAPSLPSCSLKTNRLLTTQSVQVTVYAEDGTTVEYALVENGKTPSDNNWSKASGNVINVNRQGVYSLYYRVVDTKSGLKSDISSKYDIYYDTTSPRSPIIETSKDASNQRLYIDITTTEDNGSDITNIFYRIDGGTWRSYNSRNIYLTHEGSYVVEAYCVDECGNESSIAKKTINFTYKDLLVLPTVKRLDSTPTSGSVRFKINNSYTNTFDYQYKFVKKGSRAGNSDWLDCTQNTTMTINDEGEWELYIKVSYDGSSINGSVGECAIDRTGPNIIGTAETNNNTNSVTITVDAKDDISRTVKYSFDMGKTWGTSAQHSYKLGEQIKVGDVQVKDSCDNITYVDLSGTIVQKTINKSKRATLESRQIYPLKNGITINNTAMTQGYVSGYGDNKFGPDDKVSRCQLAAIFNRVFDFTPSYGSQQRIYGDVPETHWAYKNIANVQAYNMMDTVGNTFNPNGVVSRAEMAHAICQFLNLTVVDTDTNIFTDIGNSRYKNDIIAVAKIGLVAGYGDNKFGPDDLLTRAQVVTIVNRMLGISDSSVNYSRDFDDVPRSHWAYYDIVKASI